MLSFFFLPIAAKMAQTEEFMFQNVAYRPTVYKTGPILSIVYRISTVINSNTTRA